MATLILKGSVGSGTAKKGLPHNDAADVTAVRDRLVALGYDWISGTTSGTDPDFIRTIKLFQSICAGHHKFDTGDGRVDVEGNTHRWLAAGNAPGWVKIFGKLGIGWRCTSDFVENNGGFTTTWMLDAINAAGLDYTARLLRSGLSRAINAPPMWVRECSPRKGGKAVGHGSHQTGLDVDMRLPLLPPDERKWDDLGTKGYTKPRFDRSAGQAQLESIKAAMKPKLALFNDPAFIRLKLCQDDDGLKTHDQHFHIRIKPPARKEGVVNLASLAGQIVKPVVDAFKPLF